MSTKRLHLGVAGLAALTLAGTAVVGSNAALTSSAGPSTASATAGALDLRTDKEGTAIVSLSGLRPGSVRQGVVSLTNHGSRAATPSFLPRVVGGSSALAGALTVELHECSAATVACPDAATELGPAPLASAPASVLTTLAPGITHHYRVTVRWPSGATDPNLQGTGLQASFDFEGAVGS